ncbi:HAD family hydrolase [Jannaschia sp. LMIT008]|uniref:HAD family hydrolase n=1 Tax=Jannaschia maritima TaxID=3032585 RepID=UPI0028126436|nr:HAD family hydrolase [Jannaschia sp. LMIT008]
MSGNGTAIQAILFDKDGTLTDFRATWADWLGRTLVDLSDATGVPAAVLGDAVGYDVVAGAFRPRATFVTAPFARTCLALATAAERHPAWMEAWLADRQHPVAQVPVGDVAGLLRSLRDRGLRLGVLTNDSQEGARRHLDAGGLTPMLDRIVGVDDGFGAKPGPGGALAFADGLSLDPAGVLFVGDGLTDLQAAQGAGMPFVGVLTGTLDEGAFAGAAAILPDIHHLPRWLDAQPGTPAD